ncbi:phage tail protein [Vibrio sp. Vb2853]|uniref:phage tail protein n=1 Tax=Vibrio TaxID=662 RepID=UPI00102DBA59|nr:MULTISPECIES: phage tail protein [Vibrio]MDW1615049.1 phage tail protein [Vibrio sp. Vb2881]MDW1619765.1 phage tail protein [Vibrio sp. Vb2864]MDW1691899.1 phage tail protein [Vibrio sp. Vb2853]MDW1710609.1 phage tail protein [Vibrio sp. Vb2865]MDW1715730.1 phage tail protein [Vibrio sp. Vb2873]
MVDHNKQAPPLPDSKVPWWMDGETIAAVLKEPHFLAQGMMSFWNKVRGYLLYPLRQLDPMTCSERLLKLLAWDRDITRFKEEPTALFRKRVKYAFANARDAGEVAGFVKIFERLGVGYVEIEERTPDRDWDVILIHLSDGQFSDNQALIAQLLQQYGRTCRRYEYQLITNTPLTMTANVLDWDHQCMVAVAGE